LLTENNFNQFLKNLPPKKNLKLLKNAANPPAKLTLDGQARKFLPLATPSFSGLPAANFEISCDLQKANRN
jgi:hypothetical protein